MVIAAIKMENLKFEELVKKISPKLKGITHRLNGRFTFFNDEDLYQEALLHLWLEFNGNQLSDKTESYVLQGCYFHLKNYIRVKQDKRRLISLDALVNDEGTDLEDLLPSSDPKIYFDYLNSKVLVEKMRNNGLSLREKRVLSFYLDGLTTREIGRRMGISHVGVIKLKNKIKSRYEKFIKN